MPGEDITHPVPDLTGYITEGQLVLSHELHVRGVYPPFDPLRSLSRLMRLGAGEGKTRGDHLEIAAQLYALVAQARRISDLAEVVGADALSEGERRYLGFADAFETGFVQQGRDELRPLEATLERAWQVAVDAAAAGADDGLGGRRSPPTTRRSAVALRVPPGRAGRLWLLRRLEVARRGADVLEQKRHTLLREQQRLSARLAGAAAEWERLAARGGAVERPRAGDRRRAAPPARVAPSPRPAPRVTVERRNTLGVVYPVSAVVAPGRAARLRVARRRRERGARGARPCRGAGRRGRATRLPAPRTRRSRPSSPRPASRLRAIERRWIPEHEAALHRLELTLDERELEDHVRVRWAIHRQR